MLLGQRDRYQGRRKYMYIQGARHTYSSKRLSRFYTHLHIPPTVQPTYMPLRSSPRPSPLLSSFHHPLSRGHHPTPYCTIRLVSIRTWSIYKIAHMSGSYKHSRLRDGKAQCQRQSSFLSPPRKHKKKAARPGGIICCSKIQYHRRKRQSMTFRADSNTIKGTRVDLV